MEKTSPTPRVFFLSLVLGGLFYAGCVTFLSRPNLAFDASQYFSYAVNLLNTGVYGLASGMPDAGREPGYSFFLFMVMRILQGGQKILGVAVGPAEHSLRGLIFFQSLFSFSCFASVLRFPHGSPRFRRYFLLLLVLSPSLINANAVLFSESLSVSLMVLFFFCLANALRQQHYFKWALAAGFVWGWNILTKIYFQYIPILFFLLALGIGWRARSKKDFARRGTMALVLAVIAVTSALFPFGWYLRNSFFGLEHSADFRKVLVTTGKIVKVDAMDLPKDLPPALLSAIGSNTCDKAYGEATCRRFDFRGADMMASALIEKYQSLYPSQPDKAVAALTDDIKQRWFRHPLKQLLGCAFEAVRLVFTESSDIFLSYPKPFRWFPPIWHFFGSLLVWGLACLGIWEIAHAIDEKRSSSMTLGLLAVSGTILVYHFATLTQVNVVVRYGTPVLPLLYWAIAHAVAGRAQIAPEKLLSR